MYLIYALLCAFCTAYAAGPMTHLYLAEKYCDKHNIQDEKDRRDFFVGALFPDIRYIADIERESTHPITNEIQEVAATPTLFEAGMRFHVWVDIKREQFVEESGIYNIVIPFAEDHQTTLLKFIEEEILADQYNGLRWFGCFDGILAEEESFAIAQERIEKWHSLVQYSMQYRPSWLLWGNSHLKKALFGLSNNTIYEWSYLLPVFARQPFFQRHMQDLLAHLEVQL